jgi:hypothetical protein
MRKVVIGVLLFVGCISAPSFAQNAAKEAEIQRAVPYSVMVRKDPTITYDQYLAAVRALAAEESQGRSTRPAAPIYQPPSTYSPAPIYTPPAYVPPVRSYTAPRPESGTTYDWQSGNSYSWRHEPDGNTKVNGFNVNTGSIWNTTIKPNGSMNGSDSHMNPWTYDANTKTYMNFGTGKICVGEGAARVCS